MWEKRFFLNTKFQEMLSCSLAINELTKLNFVNKKLSKNRSPKDPVCNFATIKRVIFHNFDDPKLFESGSRRLIEYWFQHLNMSDENPCKDMCDSWEYKWTKTQEQNAPANVSQLILTVGNIMYPVVQEVPSMEWQDFLGIIGGTWGKKIYILNVHECYVNSTTLSPHFRIVVRCQCSLLYSIVFKFGQIHLWK